MRGGTTIIRHIQQSAFIYIPSRVNPRDITKLGTFEPSLTPPTPTEADMGVPANMVRISPPVKVISKILVLEFVDIADLVQGNWPSKTRKNK